MKLREPVPILLFSANEYHSLYVARALSAGKYTIYFLGPAGQAIRFSRFCRKYFTCARTDAMLAGQINSISKQYKIAAVIPLDLSAAVCTSRLSHNLTCPVFPLSSVDDIMLLAGKWKTISLLRTLDIQCPKTILVKNPQELTDTILPKPFLIKPLMQAAGNGQRKISSRRDMEQYKKVFSPYKRFPLIVQEYIKGTDIDLSIVARDGVIRGWTIQRWWTGGELEFVDDPEMLSIGRKLVRHLRYSGFLHIDMRRDVQSGKLVVLDCNPRAWGSIGASIGAGVNFIDLALQCAQNIRVGRVRQEFTTYLAPVRLLMKALKNPRLLSQTSYASRNDFIGMFTDPLPYFILYVKLCLKRINLRFTYTAGARQRLIDMERNAFLSHITRLAV